MYLLNMKIINFLVIALACTSCGKIVSTGTNQNTPKTNYPRVALSPTNLNGSWTWACHTDNLIGLPIAKSFVENAVITGTSMTTIIQAYVDTGCTMNAYTLKYTSAFLLSLNPAIMTEQRTDFQLMPLSDAMKNLLNNAPSGKNAFCGYSTWAVGTEIDQFFSVCKLPASSTRNITMYSNGTKSEMMLASCTTTTNCASGDYLSQ
jgi:hypothetical protein